MVLIAHVDEDCMRQIFTVRSPSPSTLVTLQGVPEDLRVIACNETSTAQKEVAGDKSLLGCQLPTSVKQAYQLSGSTSYLTYRITPQVFHHRPHFSLDVRTSSANGLLLYITSGAGRAPLALYMSNGRVRLALGGKEIFLREKYNNGKWHTIVFSWEKRRFRLVVDGLHARDGQLTQKEHQSLDLQPPVYLGSVSASTYSKHEWKTLPQQSVIGCIRNFNLNGQPMAEPDVNHGVAPCFDGHTESGAFFSGHGGYVVIEESFVVGVSFELVFEVRPRNLTGVLFHVGGRHGHWLSLFIRKGEVTVLVNNGVGEFGVSVTPQQTLCDGMFHRIAVIKRNNVVQLDVDTEGQYTVGPSSAVFNMTQGPLYVGGIPETLWHVKLPLNTSFAGCLQNVRVNGELVWFDKVSQVFGPVNLRDCPGG